MSESSWFLKSPWAATYFRHAPEGTVFLCPSPWMFGRSREYRLSDAQAAQLVARVGRAYVRGVVILCAGLLIACLIVLSALPESPIAAGLAVTIICLLLLGACLAIVYRAAASVLAEQPWTVGELQESDCSPDDASNRGVDCGFRRDADLISLVSHRCL
jgi:hypothetical protein